MKKKEDRGKRKLIKRGKNGEPTVIDFNLSKAVIIAIAIGVIIVTITTVKIITTLIGAREENSLQQAGEDESSENVNWVEDDDGNLVPVPAGYSASKIPGETSVNTGFVIYEGDIDWSTILVDEDTSGEGESNNNTGGEEASGGGTLSDRTDTGNTTPDGLNYVVEGETIESIETENAKPVLLTQGETYDEGDEESEPETLSEDDEEETTVTKQEQNIYDLQRTTNQWVWVPVSEENISRIYGVDSNGKLWGKLYSFSTSNSVTTRNALNWTIYSTTNSTTSLIKISSTTGYREPDTTLNLIAYGTDSILQSYLDGTARYELLFKEMEENFYLMIKSIKEYGGFYIGRYETGGLNGTAVVQKMNTNINSQTWYTMYEKCKELKGDNDNVITSMIWGCLWDETLEWLVDSEATLSDGETKLTYYYVGSNSTEWGNYSNATFSYIPSGSTTPEATATSSGIRIPTGSAEYTKVNNIYDLAGNVYEWTLEAYSTGSRVYRGGYYYDFGSSVPASYRGSSYHPTNYSSYVRVSCSTFNKVRYPEILYPVRQNNRHETRTNKAGKL